MRSILVAGLLVLAASTAAAAGFALPRFTQPELLEPEKAFRILARPLDERHIEVRFAIADGYYMYRDRFKFETASGKRIAEVHLPPGMPKRDAFFGQTQIYRREAVIRLPVNAEDVRRGSVKLKVSSQGCADVGVCYVPTGADCGGSVQASGRPEMRCFWIRVGSRASIAQADGRAMRHDRNRLVAEKPAPVIEETRK